MRSITGLQSVVIINLGLDFPSSCSWNEAKLKVSRAWWPLYRGDINGRTLVGMAKRWPWPLNAGLISYYFLKLFRDFDYWPLNSGWPLNRGSTVEQSPEQSHRAFCHPTEPHTRRPLKGNLDSGIGVISACGIRNPLLWNSLFSSRNPKYSLRLQSGIQIPLTRNPGSSNWNPASKTVLN